MPDARAIAATEAAPVYLYEFLYRGRALGAGTVPDYHVILAHDTRDAFGNAATALSAAMTPDQAKARGFDIGKIVATIDTAIMKERDTLAARVADLQARLAAAEGAEAA